MRSSFAIKFLNQERFLSFDVYDSPIAKRWFELLKISIQKSEIKERNRLVNFHEDMRGENIVEINEIISRLNNVWNENFSKLSLEDPSLQQRLNQLHKLFETYRGRINSPPDFFIQSSSEIQEALERMNVLIHQLEGSSDSPRLVITFKENQREDLLEDDYQYFTPIMKYGEVYINYCDTGRELIEAFQAHDDVVGEDNLRPLRFLSSDFRIYFPKDKVSLIENHQIHDFEKFLVEKGFTPRDPKNSIGRIPVAKLSSDIPRQMLIHLIREAGSIEEVLV